MRAESVVLEIFTSERCRKRNSLPELRETRKKAIATAPYIDFTPVDVTRIKVGAKVPTLAPKRITKVIV